jgi:ribokinase
MNAMQRSIVVVGSINLDLVTEAGRIPQAGETVTGKSFKSFCGGKGANQAVAIAKLGCRVSMVGNVGNDAFGSQLRKGLDNAGVDTAFVSTVEGSSGVALITVGQHGENTIVVVPGANGRLRPEQLEKAAPVIKQAGFLLVQLEIPLETVDYVVTFADRYRIPVMLDPAPAHELSPALLRKVAWITPNATEATLLLNSRVEESDEASYFAAADRLLALGAGNVLLKLGSRGCLIAQRSQPKEHVPAFPVKAVDTTAAGDAFNAGFAVGLLRNQTPTESAVFASAVAGISVTRNGAQPSLPTAEEVDRFLQRTPHSTLSLRSALTPSI